MSDTAPAPGWWKASDGRWYPPRPADQPPAEGWWKASDGRWYPPEKRPGGTAAPAGAASTGAPAGRKVVKKVAVKKVVKKMAVKAATPPAAPAPAAAKAATPPAAKPAPAPAPAAAAATAPAPAPTRAPVPGDRSPANQIAIRDAASKADARVLAAARSAAASRALSSLQAQIDAELAASGRATATDAGPPAAKAPAAKAPAAKAPAAKASPATGTGAAEGATIERAPTGSAGGETPLMEIKPSAVSTDIDRIGERFVIFDDRVELHDRLGRVREAIEGDQIVDVVITKRLTGHIVTVEAGDGRSMQARGLRADQAQEVRSLIMRRTRRGPQAPTKEGTPDRPAGARPGATAPAPAPAAAPSAPPAPDRLVVDADELIAKLRDLHEAGVLTVAELSDKTALVLRLAGDKPLSTTPR